MWYLILYTQWFARLSSIYSTNVAKNINLLFNNGYLGSFPSPQQAAGYSTEINYYLILRENICVKTFLLSERATLYKFKKAEKF